MEKPSGIYVKRTKNSSAFRESASEQLANRHLKQIRRNFLLGQLLAKETDATFVYIYLFPKGNIYQDAVCQNFAKQLKKEGVEAFYPLTYEQFLSAAGSHLPPDSHPWIDYLRRRYICE